MNYSEKLADLDNHCVRIDWKAELDDLVYGMNERWGAEMPFLMAEPFLKLVENYHSETPEEFLPAIGQELSSHGFALYNIDEDGDHYCLFAVKLEEMKDFEKLARAKKNKVHLQKQPGRKPADAAKRLDLGKQVLHEKFPVKGIRKLVWPFAQGEEGMYSKEGGFIGSKFYFLDLQKWITYESGPVLSYAYSGEFNVAAAIFTLDKKSELKISFSPTDPAAWETVSLETEGLYPLTKLFWLSEDLILAWEDKVWIVYAAARGGRIGKLLLNTDHKCTLARGCYPNLVKTGNAQHYFLVNQQFYHYENRALSPTGIPVESHTDFDSFPFNDNSFVYMNDEGLLVEQDMTSHRKRYRNLQYFDGKTNVSRYDNDWAVFLRWGHTNKTFDIAQFWNPKTDEWIRMPFGSLGKHGIRDILKLPDGSTMIYCDDLLIKVKNLFDQLRAMKIKPTKVSDWSGT